MNIRSAGQPSSLAVLGADKRLMPNRFSLLAGAADPIRATKATAPCARPSQRAWPCEKSHPAPRRRWSPKPATGSLGLFLQALVEMDRQIGMAFLPRGSLPSLRWQMRAGFAARLVVQRKIFALESEAFRQTAGKMGERPISKGAVSLLRHSARYRARRRSTVRQFNRWRKR